jgi:hypothetical protein
MGGYIIEGDVKNNTPINKNISMKGNKTKNHETLV